MRLIKQLWSSFFFDNSELLNLKKLHRGWLTGCLIHLCTTSGDSFSTYVNFIEKLTFLSPRYTLSRGRCWLFGKSCVCTKWMIPVQTPIANVFVSLLLTFDTYFLNGVKRQSHLNGNDGHYSNVCQNKYCKNQHGKLYQDCLKNLAKLSNEN